MNLAKQKFNLIFKSKKYIYPAWLETVLTLEPSKKVAWIYKGPKVLYDNTFFK